MRRQQNHSRVRGKVFFSRSASQRFNAGEDRLGFQDHPVATAERPIVYDVVLIGGPLPQIVGLYFNQSRIARPPQNPTIDRLAKELGKDRDDIEAQHPVYVWRSPSSKRRSKIYKSKSPSGGSTTIVFSAASISTTIESANGIKSFLAVLIGNHQDLSSAGFNH